MTAFAYRAATRDGEVVTGRMDAPGAAAVRDRLRREGLYPVRVEEGGAAAEEGAGLSLSGRLLRSDRSLPLRLARELSGLLDSGFSLDASLELLADMFPDPGGSLVAGVREQVREGVPLSEALGGRPERFDRFYVAMVRAGEEAGALPEVLGRLADRLERRAEARRRVTSALVYPAIMTVVGGAAVAVLLVSVLPKFVSILEGAEQQVPLTTALLLDVSALLTDHGWLLLLLGAVAVVAWGRIRGTEAGRRRLDAALLSVPLVGRLRREELTSRFCRTLATLLESGVSFLGAVGAAAETVPNRVFRDAFAEVSADVERGEPMAPTLAETGAVPELAVRMVRLGEESGQLGTMLRKAADVYDRRVEETTDRLVSLVEPALILFFGVLVGFVAFAMVEAVFSVTAVPM